ncbi:MAG: ATP-dependent endonuclease [Candidatus Lokiarchaeota archaeon]|nr:ATP-dependent endonuclease [Candidatus Harpocratesius repetitus]
MQIQRVKIQNYRTMKKCTCFLFPYMVFVGKNNAGKSNLMKALNVFFHNNATLEDFRIEKGKRVRAFSIILTFKNLNQEEKELFKDFIYNPGSTSEKVVIRFNAKRNGEVIHSEYTFAFKTLDPSTEDEKKKYLFLDDEGLNTKSKLLKASNVPDDFKEKIEKISEQLSSGERFSKKHIIRAKREYIDEIIKKEKIHSKIIWEPLAIKKTDFERYFGHYFFIPAVQDITQETTFSAKGNTNISKLMRYIFAQMQNQDRQQQYEAEIRRIIQEIYRINKEDSEINKLREGLNSYLSDFDGSQVRFDTELPSINKVVRDSLKIFINDGVETEVEHKGHGLQRYFMVILFKAWANKLVQKNNSNPTQTLKDDKSKILASSSLFFAIEEPELFLHPQYQRLMKYYLKNIAEAPDNQVILNTHSPNFIDFKEYKKVARVVKPIRDGVPCTEIIQPIEYRNGKLEFKDLTHAHGSVPEKKEKFHKINALNLDYFMDPHRNELFFADRVVLVEGETEKLMFQQWAEYFLPNEADLLATTTYIDMGGKFNAQLYETLLNGFEIPYVIIIDNDKGSEDQTMNSTNYHIKKTAEKGTGTYIELEGDFEAEFGITGHELDRHGQKKHKPYVAFKTFFDDKGKPKKEALERIRKHPKWKTIVKAIYNKEI